MSSRTDSLSVQKIGSIRPLLENCLRPLVVSHVDPDGDAIGTQLAFGEYFRRIGKKPVLLRESDIPSKYLFLPGVENVIAIDNFKLDPRFDLAVVLECPNRNRIGAVARLIGDHTTVINIDHHQDNVLEAAVSWVDTTASSVGELACEYFQEIGFPIDQNMATALYTAILTDTGRFRFESTTARTLNLAAELVRAGADPRMITDRVYFDMKPAVMKLTGRVMSGLEYYDDGEICFMTLTNALLQETGADLADTEGLVDYSLFTEGVMVGALLREISPDRTKVSLRSRNGVDVSVVASYWKGGGHRNAAGCTIDLPLTDAKNALLEEIREHYVGR